MIDIFSLSVEEMASKIKEGQLTSVEICQKYIERINKFEKDIKAWVHFDKKILLEKAADADEYRKSGKPVGPLHGIPVALNSITAPHEDPAFLTAKRYSSQRFTDFLSGQKKGFFLISESFQFDLSQDIKPN